MTDAELRHVIEELQEAVRALEPPFLALPERGETAEQMAYRRGARDAYVAVVTALTDKTIAEKEGMADA
jgi:hypothetical protein